MTRTALLALALAAAAAGCSDTQQTIAGCNQDSDCGNPDLFRCNVETAECMCKGNGACAEGEVCNSQGYCQAKVGCYTSPDCPAGYFCDVSTNTCLPSGRCASDLHCPIGQLCDPDTSLCKAGCRTHGDCNLHEACLCKTKDANGAEVEAPCTCDATTPAERSKCAVGRCSNQTCGDQSFCGFGEVCRPPPEGGLNSCQSDYDPQLRPYCDNCVYSPGKSTCGTGPNFCLIDTTNGTNFCGTDCSSGQQCPNGYSCEDVVVVFTQWQCSSDASCASPQARSTITCKEDADCPNHATCAKAVGAESGYCAGKCLGSEGGTLGFCSCVVDSDCFQDVCDSQTRTCTVSKKPCDLNGQGCQQIHCVDFGTAGGCHIGQNCAPVEGLTCNDVKRQ